MARWRFFAHVNCRASKLFRGHFAARASSAGGRGRIGTRGPKMSSSIYIALSAFNNHLRRPLIIIIFCIIFGTLAGRLEMGRPALADA